MRGAKQEAARRESGFRPKFVQMRFVPPGETAGILHPTGTPPAP